MIKLKLRLLMIMKMTHVTQKPDIMILKTMNSGYPPDHSGLYLGQSINSQKIVKGENDIQLSWKYINSSK